jgi:replicative DNA helicase Mcm
MATLASGKLSEQFEDFLKSVMDRSGNPLYRGKISQMISGEGKSLVVDFGDLVRYNSDLANRVLLEPDSSLASFKIAAFETMRSENALYADRVKRELTVRLRSLTDLVPLRKVDTSYIDHMIAISGMVVRTSELRPMMTEAAWLCPSGHLTYEVQDDLVLKRPPKCELCGETRNFELDRRHSRFIDFQVVRVQELPEELPPGQLPQFFDVNVEGDIVNTARPGDRVVLTGVVRAVPDYSLGQFKTRLFRSQIDCNHVEVRGKEPEQVLVTKEDEELIKKIAAVPDAYERLVNSIAPVILGHQAEKEAILLLLAGGSATVLPDGTKLRGDINALFVGDPGTGKSELLKFASQVAPRGLYASGRGTTAAGLSAAVIREKNVLMLEAGVVVLADLGIAAIDEFEKMKPEDRTALHEMMEQQSYHPLTEIMFANGEKKRIGDIVEAAFESRREAVIVGKDCEILPLDQELRLHCVGPDHGIICAAADRFSRHRAPDHFVKVSYSNGRSVVVTPEHPVFVYRNGGVSTVPASEVRKGDFVPAPATIPPAGQGAPLVEVPAAANAKRVLQQTVLTPALGRVLGYLITEGNFHHGRTTETNFANYNEWILKDMNAHAERLFGFKPIERKLNGKPIVLRYLSKVLYDYFVRNFPEMVKLAKEKRIPKAIFAADGEVIKQFLTAAFLGDGGVETEAICYRTSSRGLAEDYQDLLLRLGISSRIVTDRSNGSYKVYVMGDSMPGFCKLLVDEHDSRRGQILWLMQRGLAHIRHHDVLPTDVVRTIIRLRFELGLSYDGRYWRNLREGSGITRDTFNDELNQLESRLGGVVEILGDRSLTLREVRTRIGWSQAQLAATAGTSRGNVDYLERGGYGIRRFETESSMRSAAADSIRACGVEIFRLGKLRRLRFLRVREVERLENRGDWRTDWVYDITVEPTHNFIASGLVLHNTVTIAKGGIYATLNARTAILAACNPVLGRYNPFQNLTDNIGTLPIPLLTRFDIIFVFRDQPTPAEDERLATHILAVHARRSYTTPPPIEFSLLKKYLTYAKRISPTLTKGAVDRLKEFYLELRRSGGAEDSIPPTPRTLEALIRIATARARVLLREEVTEEDALAAIALMNRMVEDVLTDATTKKTDFGIQLGRPAGERKNITTALEVLKSLEGAEKKQVERKVFKEELIKEKFSEEDAEKMIRTMFREGMVYESKSGFIRRLGG